MEKLKFAYNKFDSSKRKEIKNRKIFFKNRKKPQKHTTAFALYVLITHLLFTVLRHFTRAQLWSFKFNFIRRFKCKIFLKIKSRMNDMKWRI